MGGQLCAALLQLLAETLRLEEAEVCSQGEQGLVRGEGWGWG